MTEISNLNVEIQYYLVKSLIYSLSATFLYFFLRQAQVQHKALEDLHRLF